MGALQADITMAPQGESMAAAFLESEAGAASLEAGGAHWLAEAAADESHDEAEDAAAIDSTIALQVGVG